METGETVGPKTGGGIYTWAIEKNEHFTFYIVIVQEANTRYTTGSTTSRTDVWRDLKNMRNSCITVQKTY